MVELKSLCWILNKLIVIFAFLPRLFKLACVSISLHVCTCTSFSTNAIVPLRETKYKLAHYLNITIIY